MTDADDETLISILSLSPRMMPSGTSSSPPYQRPRHVATHRRAISAPDPHGFPSSGSASSSSAHVSSGTPSSSHCSYSHREERSSEFHRHRSHITPLAPIHSGEQSFRSTSAPTTAHTSAPPASTTEGDEDMSQNMEMMARRLEDMRRTLSRQQRRNNGVTLSGLWVAAQGVFGYGPEGTAARRESMSLTGKLLFGIGQITGTITLLTISSHHRSPTDPSLSEWKACPRPLGVWCSIWCVRLFLGCFVAIWGYRSKGRRLSQATEHTNQSESSNGRRSHAPASANDVDAHLPRTLANDSRVRRNNDARPTQARRNNNVRSTQARPNQQVPAAGAGSSRSTSLLTSLSFVWFITANVLAYTTVNTCRHSSPHLWWLMFGLVCIGYLVIVEVVVIALLVFIVWPVIYIFISIILVCLGRHPLRNGPINPDIGKLSQKEVDQLPLVLYIPAPKETQDRDALSWHPSPSQGPSMPQLPIPEPAHIHSYPPDTERATVSPTPVPVPGTRVRSRSRRLFTFRRVRPKKDIDEEQGKETQSKPLDEEQGYRYEDKWEKGEYPFVKLEDNRAACAICLCDFDEPRRVRYSIDSKPPEDLGQEEKAVSSGVAQVETERGLRLTDAGEGAQPLRRLECAHVFHKTCLDPWLTGVSGRCPVCQQPVEVKVPKKNRTSR